MGSLLRGVSRVRWDALRGAQQVRAAEIPVLLSRIAYGDEDTARLAVEDLADCVCWSEFLAGEATAPTVPFLLELAGAPHVPCKAELLELLEHICRAEQWHRAASSVRDDKRCTAYREQPCWEAASRAAVRAGRPVVAGLASSVRPEEAEPARRLLRAMDEVPSFPEV